jgi:U1 small nuclear ribonucleoprotein
VHLVKDQQGNSRGYAFVEFENKDDFNHAYKNANQRKLSGRRMLVDFERGNFLLI